MPTAFNESRLFKNNLIQNGGIVSGFIPVLAKTAQNMLLVTERGIKRLMIVVQVNQAPF